MAKRSNQAQPGQEGPQPPVASQQNPIAAPRRRLLRALGGSAAAAGVVFSAYWQRPVVSAVVLPAHAQTSPGPGREEDPGNDPGSQPGTEPGTGPGTDPPPGCSVSFQVEVFGGTDAYQATLIINTEEGTPTSLDSANAFEGGSTALGGSTTLPPGSYFLGIEGSRAFTQALTGGASATCCDAQTTLSYSIEPDQPAGTVTSGFFNGGVLVLEVVDDGQCTFLT